MGHTTIKVAPSKNESFVACGESRLCPYRTELQREAVLRVVKYSSLSFVYLVEAVILEEGVWLFVALLSRAARVSLSLFSDHVRPRGDPT